VPNGTYTVTESAVSGNFAFASVSCTASGAGTSATQNALNDHAVDITVAGGGSVTCTYVNNELFGAIKILKNSAKGGAVANAGAVFAYGSSSVTDNGTGDEDSTVGVICVSGLTPGDYSVSETTPPSGYSKESGSKTATAVAGTDCGAHPPTAALGGVVTFTDHPLSDIQVNFRDGGSGETSATISCDNTTGTTTTTPPTGWDTSKTVTGIDAPTTVVCTIVIDP
jgi:hypothetical protein